MSALLPAHASLYSIGNVNGSGTSLNQTIYDASPSGITIGQYSQRCGQFVERRDGDIEYIGWIQRRFNWLLELQRDISDIIEPSGDRFRLGYSERVWFFNGWI